MPILELSVVPVGTGSESFGDDVERAVAIIEQNGLNYQVTPTSTIVEGDIDKLFDVAQAIHLNEIQKNAPRVVTTMKIDDRKDKDISLDSQVNRVKK
ncbi:MAG: thiamine-binding protein [Alkalicoccus sp.]|nr:MAG: thiamine-binding protein [Alkalicoccus sp.]